MKSLRRSGTSLVEVLVVMVVFLIGILAIVQIFPGGFRALSTTQKNTNATAIGRSMLDIIKNHADQLPDSIVPVRYVWNGSQFVIEAEPDRFSGNLGPSYAGLDQTGTMYDGVGNPIGNWQYLVAANVMRRVIGEGGLIPAPRQVGAEYGSLLSLQFAPLVYNPQYQSLFVVYGNNLIKRHGDPIAGSFNIRSTEFFVDEEDSSSAKLFLPTNPTRQLAYRVEMTCHTTTGGNNYRRDIVDLVIPVAASTMPATVQISNYVADLQWVEYDSIRVARVFEDVNVTNGGVFHPGEPYEYKLLSQQLGLVLFNPAGYNYTIRTRRGRPERLTGRVSYDVYDWRIIREEFRAPDVAPFQHRLALGGLKVAGEVGPDGRNNQGIGVQVPDGSGTLGNVDLILQDSTTGALFAFEEGTADPQQTSYLVDKSIGLVTLLDYDTAAPGLQMLLQYPGAAVMTPVTVDGRSIKAMYMAKGEWAAQVLKPSARYIQTWGRPGIGEYYVGGSVAGDNLNPRRIYFPQADGGRMVSLGEIYYFNGSGIPVGPVPLTAKVQTNNMGPEQLPYVQVSDYYPDFAAFDYSYGTSVKNVRGASVAVRVLWNPDTFRLSTDPVNNMERLDNWMQGWRRQTVETYLQREN